MGTVIDLAASTRGPLLAVLLAATLVAMRAALDRPALRRSLQLVLAALTTEALVCAVVWWRAVAPVAYEPAVRVEVPTEPPVSVDARALLPTRLDTDAHRVLFVGDSFTHGQGVLEADRFSRTVVDLLSDRGRDVVELNQADTALSFVDEVVLYLDVGARLAPDVVVWTFVLNDLPAHLPAEVRTAGHDLIMDRRGDTPPWSVTVALWQQILADRAVTRTTEQAYAAAFGDDGAAERLAALTDRLRVVADEVHGRGGRLLFTVFPMLHRLDAYPFTGAHEAILDAAGAAGAETLDLLPVFEGRDASTLWFSPADHHPNARAHALAGHAIATALGELGARVPVPDCDRLPPGERAALRAAICRDPDTPEPWLSWARWWVEHPDPGPPGLGTPRRYVDHGLVMAWLTSSPHDRDAVQSAIADIARDAEAMP